jgi:hypothetical protein
LVECQRIDLKPTKLAGHEMRFRPASFERLYDSDPRMPLPFITVGVLANHGRNVLNTFKQV